MIFKIPSMFYDSVTGHACSTFKVLLPLGAAPIPGVQAGLDGIAGAEQHQRRMSGAVGTAQARERAAPGTGTGPGVGKGKERKRERSGAGWRRCRGGGRAGRSGRRCRCRWRRWRRSGRRSRAPGPVAGRGTRGVSGARLEGAGAPLCPLLGRGSRRRPGAA